MSFKPEPMFICVAWYASLSIVVRELLQRTAFAMTKNVKDLFKDLLWVRIVREFREPLFNMRGAVYCGPYWVKVYT